MRIVYENKLLKPKVIEQNNWRTKAVSFFLWEENIMGDTGFTVCIWRIKYKK